MKSALGINQSPAGEVVQSFVDPEDQASGRLRNLKTFIAEVGGNFSLKYDMVTAYGLQSLSMESMMNLSQRLLDAWRKGSKKNPFCLVASNPREKEVDGPFFCQATGGVARCTFSESDSQPSCPSPHSFVSSFLFFLAHAPKHVAGLAADSSAHAAVRGSCCIAHEFQPGVLRVETKVHVLSSLQGLPM